MDFKDLKRKKARGQTNEEFLAWVLDQAKDFEQICIVVQRPSDEVEIFYSQEGTFHLVGMLEVGKAMILDGIH
jgi:hypothetical protein|nr:MAG TPA: hypothetical protein [Caudoviricetes sp.]